MVALSLRSLATVERLLLRRGTSSSKLSSKAPMARADHDVGASNKIQMSTRLHTWIGSVCGMVVVHSTQHDVEHQQGRGVFQVGIYKHLISLQRQSAKLSAHQSGLNRVLPFLGVKSDMSAP